MKTISIVIVLILPLFDVRCSDLCDHKSKSCTNHLWTQSGGPSKMCYMTHYKLNSTECASLNFQYKTDAAAIGNVQLKAYVTEEFKQSLIDVLFTNIQWKKALMRFSSMESKNEKNMCRKFNIWENATVPRKSALKYDCPWSDKSYEAQNFVFEYELSLSAVLYKKFIFRVPSFNNFNHLTKLKSLEIFCYVDVTDPDDLSLHIQTADLKYNITNYFIEVMRERNDTTTRLTVQVLDAKEAVNGELVYTYSTWNEYGSIYFKVSPINNICKENECLTSVTPKHLVGRKKSSLAIGMVGASIIIFAVFYGLIFWNKKERRLYSAATKVMIVYNPSTNTHSEVVRNLARILQGAFCLTITIDSEEVNYQDPNSWCHQSFNNASQIVYVASPKYPSTSIQTNASRTHDIALRYIKKELASSHRTKQVLLVTFPYSRDSLPSEFSHLRAFNLMDDFDEFSRCIKPPTPFVPTTLLIWSAQHLEMYSELINSVILAEKELETLNFPVNNNRAPNILVTENISEDEDTNEDEPLKPQCIDDNNRLSKLNLDGNGVKESEEHRPQTANINIYENYILDDIKL